MSGLISEGWPCHREGTVYASTWAGKGQWFSSAWGSAQWEGSPGWYVHLVTGGNRGSKQQKSMGLVSEGRTELHIREVHSGDFLRLSRDLVVRTLS